MIGQEIFESIKMRILSMKDIDSESVSMDSSFSFLSFDSLDYVEIQVFILDSYRVSISDELFAHHEIATLEQLVKYVTSNINQ